MVEEEDKVMVFRPQCNIKAMGAEEERTLGMRLLICGIRNWGGGGGGREKA